MSGWRFARLTIEDDAGREYTFALSATEAHPLHATLSLNVEALKTGEVDVLGRRWLTYEVGERALCVALCGPLILATRRQDD